LGGTVKDLLELAAFFALFGVLYLLAGESVGCRLTLNGKPYDIKLERAK